jgi:4-hydroxybenzoate polyprenyltransferase
MPNPNIRAYAQLLRIPNVFTALADICLGWLALGGLERALWKELFIALGASACLYSAGMVLNDYYDVEVDRKERPFRPIPSGRISRRTAGWLGLALLSVGVALTFTLCDFKNVRPLEVGVLLSLSIVLYDAWLKRTPLGPLGMGLCRFLNVMLGLHAVAVPRETWAWHLAAIVGLYIVGVTWFARREAEMSRRSQLLTATGVMLAALILALLLPAWWAPSERLELRLFPYLLVAWGIVIAPPIIRAINRPEPGNVQKAIKRCLMGLIGLDAVLAFAFVGWPALTILLLLAPAMWLGRWVYST